MAEQMLQSLFVFLQDPLELVSNCTGSVSKPFIGIPVDHICPSSGHFLGKGGAGLTCSAAILV
jgi:hypothetical protein